MNCYNHAETTAVASCIDCGKGLCKECASLYSSPICNECNLARVGEDRSSNIKVFIPSMLFFIIGFVLMMMSKSHEGTIIQKILSAIVLGYLFGGIPWGWRVITFITPQMFLFMSIFGWIIYFVLKLILSFAVGIVAMPIAVIRLLVNMISARNKEELINENLRNG